MLDRIWAHHCRAHIQANKYKEAEQFFRKIKNKDKSHNLNDDLYSAMLKNGEQKSDKEAKMVSDIGLVYLHVVDPSGMGAPEVPASLKEKLRKKEFSELELEKLQKGISNAEFHYLGSGKTYSLKGRAFADAVLNVIQQ